MSLQEAMNPYEQMAAMEAIWNRPVEGDALPEAKTLEQALADPKATPARKAMLGELADMAKLLADQPVAQPTQATTPVSRASGQDRELALMLTRQGLLKPGMGPYATAMLEGMLEDHPTLVLSLIQDKAQPVMINLTPLRETLQAFNQKMERVFDRELERALDQAKTPSNDPVAMMRSANQARMTANERVMALIQDRLQSRKPLR